MAQVLCCKGLFVSSGISALVALPVAIFIRPFSIACSYIYELVIRYKCIVLLKIPLIIEYKL